MPQKRKHSTSIASPQKPKFAKTTEESQKRFKTAAKPAVADEEESSNGEDVFEGFGSDDQEESESEDEESSEESEEEDSDESMEEEDSDESMEEEEGDEDELDNDDEDEEQEEMDVDETVDGTEENRKQISKTSSIKEVPAHAAQRALAKERKLSRPNAQKLSEAKKIWESLRQQKGLSKKDREAQVTELYNLIAGDIPTLVFGHSASRFVQTAMKYGSPEQRLTIARELEGRYIELAKAKYGKFLVGKILEYGDAKVRELVVKEFMGNVGRLIVHKEAGMVLNDIYRDICTPAEKLEMLHELYGPEFRLFQSEKGMSLEQILKEKPQKKEMISKNLIELLKNCMKKDIINLDLVHTALLQALQISSPKDIEELVSLFKEQIHQLAHTKDGSFAACLLISYGTAKDRKAMIKSIKDIIPQMSTDQYGHMVLIVICAVVDDTKLVTKSVLAELKPLWSELIRNKFGRKLVLFLCREDENALVKQYREKSANTSKKDVDLRRGELLEFVSDDFLAIVENQAAELMIDPLTIQVVQEILLFAKGEQKKVGAVRAVTDLAARHPSNEDHIIRLPFTARVYKTLVQGGHYNPAEKKVEVVDKRHYFARQLAPAIQPNLVAWATGDGSFVVLSLFETLCVDGKDPIFLYGQLQGLENTIRTKGGDNKGTKLLLEKMGQFIPSKSK